MSEDKKNDWKVELIAKWSAQNPPAAKDERPDDVVLKTSVEVAAELSTFGRITPEEITTVLILMYDVEFEGGHPHWRIKKPKTILNKLM